MLALIKNFAADEKGATAIEYGLIAGLIVVVLIAVMTNIGNYLNTDFTSVATALR